jgi:hypothetical protein
MLVLTGFKAGRVERLVFTPDGGVAAPSFMGVHVWRHLTTGATPELLGGLGSVTDFAFSPDGAKLMAQRGWPVGVVVRDGATGESAVVEPPPRHSVIAALAPDGRHFVLGLSRFVWDDSGHAVSAPGALHLLPVDSPSYDRAAWTVTINRHTPRPPLFVRDGGRSSWPRRASRSAASRWAAGTSCSRRRPAGCSPSTLCRTTTGRCGW